MSVLFDESDIAVVTGASGAIGAAIALELAAEGAPVVVHYWTNSASAEAVVARIRREGGRAVRYRADLRIEDDVVRMFKVISARLGSVRILVNNAGAVNDGFLSMMGASRWSDVMDTNLNSAFYCLREALKPMIFERRGSVVNITSVSAIIGTPGQGNYSAAKAGLIGLTRSASREVGRFGIRVNAVAPGLLDDGMGAGAPRDVVQMYREMASLRRLCTSSDVASAVAFLLSNRAKNVTGQTIAVDGGLCYG